MTRKQLALQNLQTRIKPVFISILIVLFLGWLISLFFAEVDSIILIETGSLIFFICSVFADYFIAKTFYLIAIDKGYFSMSYFWFCFIFGIVGYIMVAAMPDRGNAANDEIWSNDVVPQNNFINKFLSSKKTDNADFVTSEAPSPIVADKNNDQLLPTDPEEKKNLIIGVVCCCFILFLIVLSLLV